MVELGLTAHIEDAVGNGERKRILSLALKDVIDPTVLEWWDEIGFQTPPQWLDSEEFKTSFGSPVEEMAEPLERFIDFERAKELLGARTSRRNRNDLWRIYNLLLWYSQIGAKYQRNQNTAT